MNYKKRGLKLEIVEEKIIKYKCSICKHVYTEKHDVEICEKRHRCIHSKVCFTVDHQNFNAPIIKMCIDCGEVVGEVDLYDIEDNQKALEKVFNLIKKIKNDKS